ncbi:unnamed protein product [Paramecium octaurelia]|uniref:Protein kinase domain-containing protein n=1 Tax=Paramecium octaurelia TaxID=43137 RepID=A0A8S1WSS8_PAROT|nr:unnamed protein product [Paramecium octaurelia]
MDILPYQPRIGFTRTQRVRSMLQTPISLPQTSSTNFNQNIQGQNQSNIQFKRNRQLRNSFSELPGFQLKNYQFQGTLGKGQFAKVYKAQRKSDGLIVAIKVYEKCFLNMMRKQNIQREINILNQLEHPNIIKLIEVVDNLRGINLIMEYGGDENLRDLSNRSESNIKQIIRQMTRALNYLQSKQIIHRDLKLDNVLINNGVVKLIDFGFAVQTDGNKLSVFCGTPNYMAPELLLKIVCYSYEVDMWALGIILYHLIAIAYPFKGKNEQELYACIKQGFYQRPQSISELGFQFLDKLLTSNPRKRITAKEALLHKWLIEPMIKYYD